MGEYELFPNCDEDLIKTEYCAQKESEGVLSFSLTCPHCSHRIEAWGESLVHWFFEDAEPTSDGGKA